jgi:two-component system chemotaxis sensor kinase CheA
VSALDPEILAVARAEASDCLDRIERNLLELEGGSAPDDAIDAIFRDAHSIKGTAGMVGLDEAAAIAHAMEDRLEASRAQGTFSLRFVDPLLEATDALRRAVGGETVGARSVVEALEAPVSPDAGAPAGTEAPAPGPPPTPSTGTPGRSIRVSARTVDRMLDAVGETVLHHRRLEHHSEAWAQAVGRDVAEEELSMGERLLAELQDSVIGMRTLPLSSITAPLPRAVRDLAVAEDKEVELTITGGETPLDRVILEGISDTIIHLARNAVAHGIEDPAERERRSKPRAGRLELHAQQRGGMISLEVRDDGRGVSPAVLEQAREAGSLTALLSRPGFSTAPETSDLAGRGVGLDAVKSHVERLGGAFEIRSEPGAGTTVALLLPLTLALLRVLMCERGGQRFALPLASVREVVTVTRTVSLGRRRSLELHGESIPLADLAGVLGTAAAPLADAAPALVVMQSGRAVAVAVDRVLGDVEVVIKSLGPLLAGVPGCLGAAIMEDGRVGLILDPGHVLDVHADAPSGEELPSPGSRLASKVLIVDDHFTVRELQRSILESAGYRVATARDGREALGRIEAERDIELVVTDVHMPGMDGFELLGALRALPGRSSLPVAIVTSLSDEDHRRRGAELGADAYIVKQEFNQQTLLETVGRLVRP